MKISKKAWNSYRDKLSAINQKAATAMQKYIEANGLDDLDKIIAYAYTLVSRYGEAASELACEMYDAIAIAQNANVKAAEPAEPADYGTTAAAVTATSKINDGVPSVVGRMVKQVSADTTLQNARRDGAYFAWVPSGDACVFCEMLASRGWVRASKKTIRGDHADHIHNNCKCAFAISFDENTEVEGYNPKFYNDKLYAETGGDLDGQDLLQSTWNGRRADYSDVNSVRRSRYADNKDEINAQKRAAYARRKEEKTTE